MRLTLALLVALSAAVSGLEIPLEVEQLPTIFSHTSGPIVALPYDSTVTIQCKAKGNPPPQYKWTKDGLDFVPPHLTSFTAEQTDGDLVLSDKKLAQFQGKYRCFAFNYLGTAVTEEIEVVVTKAPKFPKELKEPLVVEVGQPFVLHCNPPVGVAPRKIHWMSMGLQHITQDERVSMGTNGNLYFSNALPKDSRHDYCCFADFPRIRTIVHKSAMAVVVKTPGNESDGGRSYLPEMRKPQFLLPSGVQTAKVLQKGEELQLECLPEGFPTPRVEWMRFGEQMNPKANFSNFNKMLTIPAVEDKDQGKYMCFANSSAGKEVHYFDVIVEEPPRWISGPPQSQLTVIGSDVTIKCSVSGTPAPAIVWRRNGDILEDEPLSNRRVLEDTVVIHNTVPEDNAVFQCEASNRHGTIMANINIVVMNLAPMMLTKDYHDYTVIEGGNITMNCSVFGSPPATISWSTDENPEIKDQERFSLLKNGSLQVQAVEKDDSQEYLCGAANSEGKSAITAVLSVKDATRIVAAPQSAEVTSGSTAQFTCQARYDRSLQGSFQLLWTKDGTSIPPSSDHTSRRLQEGNLLLIMNVDSSDEGVYTCSARTALDQDRASAVLTVLDVPDAPTKLQIKEVDGPRNVSLSWAPGSDHNSSVSEFLVEYEESQWEPGRWKELQKVPGNQATAELLLHGHLDYQFRVYAVNAVGPGPPSETTGRHKTPPAAPDKNPENIKIQGHLPGQLDISWEPILPVEHNGPGLEYKVSYRQLAVEDAWKEHLVKRHSFVLKNTSIFIPYEVKIQSRNSHGWGPEPRVVTGYSGGDVPSAAPRDVAVEVMNSSVLRVSWTPVPPATLRGHLRGYQVHWVRTRSLMSPEKLLNERRSLSFAGKRDHGFVPGLEAFSEYRLTVNVFNKKGNGPNSDPVHFNTTEGVPDPVPVLTASNAQRDSILLVWGPPVKTNGVLTGYWLQYQRINDSSLEVQDSRETNISGAEVTNWKLQDLQDDSLYRFLLRACTGSGCGDARVQESRTVTLEHSSTTPAAPSVHSIPALLNISSYASDTFARISWTARDEPRDSQLYVAYMNNSDGFWRISDAINASQSFHVIHGLLPGTEYTVRLMARGLFDNASIYEDVIQTQARGAAGQQDGVSTQAWFIGTMCVLALLALVVLVVCFLRRNTGGKYAVKEKEEPHDDEEAQAMHEDISCEHSDGDQKPLKSSMNGDALLGDGISRDSLVDYASDGGEFSEDGSFIGEYSGIKHRGSVGEPNGHSEVIT